MTRRELLDRGMSVRAIAAAVHRGDLLRVRRGHYADPDVDDATIRAVRVGGRLCCVSELRRIGVWCLDDARLHVRMAPNAARSRSADDSTTAFVDDGGVIRHWAPTLRPGSGARVHVLDALVQLVQCVSRREAAAAIDSALHQRRVTRAELHAALDRRGRRILARCTDQAESGIETFARLLFEDLGLRVRVQVRFAPDLRVDLVVEDWIVVECDGAEFHGAEVTTRDRNRDAVLVRRGRTVLHFRFATIVFDQVAMARTVIEAVRTHRRVRNSGQIARRALERLESGRFT